MKLLTPMPDLFLGMAMRVARTIPIEVHVVVLLKRQGRIPEQLEHVRVDEALYVMAPSTDAEIRDVLLDFNFSI
jgi:hypothetical protein